MANITACELYLNNRKEGKVTFFFLLLKFQFKTDFYQAFLRDLL